MVTIPRVPIIFIIIIIDIIICSPYTLEEKKDN